MEIIKYILNLKYKMTSLQDIIEKYNSSNNQKLKPSNYDLFILVEGSNIFNKIKEELGVRPEFKDRRLALRNAWNHIDFNQRVIYTEASLKLGYEPKLKNTFKQDRLSNKINFLRK